jgi:hypothetical protein
VEGIRWGIAAVIKILLAPPWYTPFRSPCRVLTHGCPGSIPRRSKRNISIWRWDSPHFFSGEHTYRCCGTAFSLYRVASTSCLTDLSRNPLSLFLNGEISFLCLIFFIGHGSRINLAYRFIPWKKNLVWICFYDGTTSEVSGSQIIYNTADLSLLNCMIYVRWNAYTTNRITGLRTW